MTSIKASACAGAILLLAGLALLAAAGMACAALWTFESAALGSAGASLVVSGVLLGVALILVLIAWWVRRHGLTKAPPAIAPEQIEAILAAVGGQVGEHKAAALVAAFVAGAVAEQRIRRN